MGNLHFSVDGSNLVNSFDFGAESTVHTEDISIDDGSQRKIIKDVCAVFPGVGVSVLLIDFVVKAIDSSDLSEIREGRYLDSWFPRIKVILSGYLIFRQRRSSKVSTEWYPRSTKSPTKT